MSATGATLNFTSDEAGNYYYVVYAAGDTAPTAAVVKAQGTALAKGTAAASATANTASVSGLTASTAYKAYVIVADGAGNSSLVSTIPFTTTAAAPAITSSSYDASTGVLAVTGTGFLSKSGETNDIDTSKLTITGEGGTTYTLTNSANVEITSGTNFSVFLNPTDKEAVNQIINKNGTSTTGGNTYNLAAAEDWAAGADAEVVVADLTGNGITANDVAVPNITSATYDANTGGLTVTGTGFLKLTGAANDIDVSKLTMTGEGGATYNLTSANVDITSGTVFSVTLNAADKTAVNLIVNKTGISSTGGTTYNLAAAEDWAAGADASVEVADVTSNGITASNATASPTVQAVSVPTNGTYKAGDALNFTVNFDEAITVTGTPSLSLTLNTGGTVQASYISGSVSTNLVFRYTVLSGNLDADGIIVGSLSLNGGTIQYIDGTNATLTLNNVAATTGVLVDGVVPSISSITPPSNGTYIDGQNLDFTVAFSKAVNVITSGGTPYLTLTVGNTVVHADYVSGSGTSAITFRYTVTSGDLDADGVAYSSNITANGGTIKDAAGNNAILTFTGSTATNVKVDAVVPALSMTSASGLSATGATLNFTSNEAGTYYYLVYAAADTAPDVATVKAQGSAVARGTAAASATANTAGVSGLTATTSYKAYAIVVDEAQNSSLVSTISFTTTAVPATTPEAPTAVTAIAGETSATVSFTAPTSNGGATITGYTVTSSPDGITATGATSPITVTGLTNGTAYTFTVKAANSAGTSSDSVTSNSVTPSVGSTINPTIGSFDKKESAQVAITINMILNGNTLSSIKNGSTTLTQGTDYTISGSAVTISKTYLANQATGTVNLTFNFNIGNTQTLAITVSDSTSSGSSGSSGGGSSSSTTTATSTQGASVIVNGETKTAGNASTSTVSGQTVTTVTVDTTKLEKILEAQGNKATVTIPVTTSSDVAAGVLTGQMVKNMEEKEATLEVKTSSATYTLPASEINIDAVSEQLGKSVTLSDIKVTVEIAEPSVAETKVVASAASDGDFSIVVPAVDFSINCTYNGNTVDVSSFNAYVERTIAIPDSVDPTKITTGIVVKPDGTTYHVPTKITVIDGKYYAVINSRTNSIYTVVWHPIEFVDVSTHWAKAAINNMGSRMVVNGVDESNYAPNRDVTRAEFAAIVVRALGLAPGTGENNFSDVKSTDWSCGYVKTASSYGIINGYNETTFAPNDKITREQAMTMIARAMKITGLESTLTDSEMSTLLTGYTDATGSASYAKSSIASCLKTGVVSGTSSNTLAPKNNITRAEVAVIVERLLEKSELI